MYQYPDIAKLKKAGYKVEQKSPWHFQVEQNGIICNIWPSKRKYMREFANGASIYSDVVRAVESVVGPAGVDETREERAARLREFWAREIPVPRYPDYHAAWLYEIELMVRQVERAIEKADAMDF